MTEQMTLLRQIDALDFAMQEVRLYLDTHPTDTTGITLFNQYQQRWQALMTEYERTYGPLRSSSLNAGDTWQWVKDPWPWEAAANMSMEG